MTNFVTPESKKPRAVLDKQDLGPKINVKNSLGSNSVLENEVIQFIHQMNSIISVLKNTQEDIVKSDWSLMSNPQKQFAIDVFCWKKDDFDANNFQRLLPFILEGLKNNPLASRVLFNSYEFHLFLKQKFNFYDFDQEEQNYPNDDNYFISKDFSFIFCYQENEKFIDEFELILEQIIQSVGSEYFISKLQISQGDNLFTLNEEAYQLRNSRLASSGYPNYEESLEWQTRPRYSRSNIMIENQKDYSGSHNEVTTKSALIKNKNEKNDVSLGLLKTLQAVFEYKKSNEEFDFSASEILLKESMDDVILHTKLGKSVSNDIENADFKNLYRAGKAFRKDLSAKVLEFRKFVIETEVEWSWFGDLLTNTIDDVENIQNVPVNESSPFNLRSTLGINNFKMLLEFWKKNKAIVLFYYSFKNDNEVVRNWSSYNYKLSEVNIEPMILSDFMCYFLDKVFALDNKIGLVWDDLVVFVKRWTALNVEEQDALIIEFINSKFEIKCETKIFSTYLNYLISQELLSINLIEIDQNERKYISGIILV